jgi:hypothetical protein
MVDGFGGEPVASRKNDTVELRQRGSFVSRRFPLGLKLLGSVVFPPTSVTFMARIS